MTVRAVVVGAVVIDVAFRIPRLPRDGEVILADDFGIYRGGKGYNQAVALARLGARVALAAALGDDTWGKEILAALAREGVDRSLVRTLPDVHTGVAAPLLTHDGSVGFVHAAGANAQFTADKLALLPPCDVLMLQGEVPNETSLAAAKQAQARGALIVLNPAPAHGVNRDLIDVADVLCPNEVEAKALVGHMLEPVNMARELASGRRAAVITLGARGAAFADQRTSGLFPPPPITAVDATGAGDSFCAALALAIVEGAALDEAVRFACAAGAHAATIRGAEPGLPTRAHIARLLDGS